ncbi:thioredoxin-like protein [Armillaria luteobubalina]|uniref:Thioredoxin-like protein n=1 Tax=Armillaria luteobubalina TaxID=153913 RepID=A0AA39QRN4_9AGAR|nr:thioredoxin-like protein [Armillaria luteobubalina]
MSTVVHLDRKSDFHDLISKHNDVILMFFTNWCYCCHVMRPTFEYVSGLATLNGLTFGGVLCGVNDWDVGFLFLILRSVSDALHQSDAVEEVGINCYPTIQVYRNGEKFEYLEGIQDTEEFEGWLKTYLILSRSCPHPEKDVPKGLALPPIDMAVSKARGKDPVLDISTWTGPQLEEFISQHKHVVVGLHSTNTPHGMSFCFKRAAKSSKFKDVHFLRVDCDVEQSDSAEILRELLWLRFRPVMRDIYELVR